ncbi:MAG: CHAD domain-containing protein [Planctomycetaceae bacterium]|nr:CHAD domain-containing protein [Planctomycetaceae bacterium]
MARYEKWLTDVGPDAPVAHAARKALAMRLAAVEHFLKQAGEVSGKSADDREAVHQLRIWTRRAAAALRLFDEVLPRRTAKWLKRELRATRQTAGEARDCDVLADRLESGDLPGLAPAAVHLRARRKQAAKELARACKSLLKSNKLRRKCDTLLAKIDRRARSRKSKRAAEAFGPWCRAQLKPLSEEFQKLAAGDLSGDKALHQLRLAGKRLRYALELAPAALAPGAHGRLYDDLSDLQDRLGQVCDKIVAASQLKEWCGQARSRDVRKELRAAHDAQRKQLAAQKQRFHRWWTPKRRATLRKSWEKALQG